MAFIALTCASISYFPLAFNKPIVIGYDYEMSDPQHPAGLLLSGLSRRREVEAQGRVIPRERQAGRASEGQQNAEKGKTMIYKRGRIYWYKFVWLGETIRESTKQGNDKVARQMEAAHRTSLAKGEVGIRERKPIPTLAEFCKKRFEPWCESVTTAKTWRDFYRVGLLAIKGYAPLANLVLDAISSEKIADFASHRQARGLQVSSINSSLRILRRVLRVAVEWGEIGTAPKVRMLPGERHRERVLTADEEARYLAAASGLLADVATVLVDSGLRPEECYRLAWESVTWVNGRNGTFLVTHGKTKAARRMLPMTPRVRFLLESRWEAAGRPLEGWVWPAPTKSGHLEPSSLKKQHAKALKLSGVRPFVLYTLRHTFLPRAC